MAGLARWCFRHKWAVIVLWVVVLAGLTGASRNLGEKYANVFEMPGTESATVQELMEEAFPGESGETDTIVWQVDEGSVRDDAVRNEIEPMFKDVGQVADVGSVSSPYGERGARQISADGRIAYATVTFTKLVQELTKEQMTDLVETAKQAETGGLEVEVGGQAVQLADEPPAHISELVGIAAAAIVLFLAFGSLFGMLLPILTALFGVGTGSAAIVLLSHSMDMAEVAPQLSLLIGLGVGIDYALFIVTRHRKGILRGRTPAESVVAAVNTSGRAVLFAGGTVCIALLGLFALDLRFINGVAVAAAMTVVITVIASLTLLPALLGMLGGRVLSRRQRRRLAADGAEPEEATGAAARWSQIVQRRPRLLSVLAVAVMLVLAIPTLSLRLGASDQGNNPEATTTRQAYDMLADGFGPGFNGPLTVFAELPAEGDASALEGLVADLRRAAGVAAVTAPPVKPGTELTTVQVVPETSPQDTETDDLIDRLRDDVIPAAERGSTMQAYVGGQTATMKDFASVVMDKLPMFIGVIVALGFVLLLVAFRSLVVPLTAAFMNLIAAAASFGVLVAIFQWGWGGELLAGGREGPIEAFLPVIMLSLLFGLSMDYQVFLVSRMHEEWVHTRDNRRAVRIGLTETSRVINSAAIIMICVFGAFVLSGERVVTMFGVGLAGAVALDAFILRTMLVPALMHLFGTANWWLPKWIDRWLPHLAVEPPDDTADTSDTGTTSKPAPAGLPGQPAATAGAANGAAHPGPAGPVDRLNGHAIRGRVAGLDGGPVPRAELTLIAANGSQAGRASAAADGSYAFEDLHDGAYAVVAGADGHHPQTASVLLNGGSVDGCQVRLPRAAAPGPCRSSSLSGTVRAAAGEPVAGVRVTLRDTAGTEVAAAYTGQDGGYSFLELPLGEYVLEVALPDRTRAEGAGDA